MVQSKLIFREISMRMDASRRLIVPSNSLKQVTGSLKNNYKQMKHLWEKRFSHRGMIIMGVPSDH
jgi:glutathione peroxidase-family protein